MDEIQWATEDEVSVCLCLRIPCLAPYQRTF
jgi:hypothetical protein